LRHIFQKLSPKWDDEALTGRAFAANPDPIELMLDGAKDPNIPGAVATMDDKPKNVNPGANAAVAGKTNYKASKMAGTRPSQPDVAREIFKKEIAKVDEEQLTEGAVPIPILVQDEEAEEDAVQVHGHQTAQDQAQAQDPGCQRAPVSHCPCPNTQ
jgi:hypothetical protein